MKGHLDAEQLKSMDYKSLQALAKDMGVSAAGKAGEIIARIAAVEVDVPEESQLTEGAEAAAGQAEAVQEAAAADEKAAAEQKATEDAEAAAGLVKVKAVTRFLDKQLNQIKNTGEVYSVSSERAAVLAEAGVAVVVG